MAGILVAEVLGSPAVQLSSAVLVGIVCGFFLLMGSQFWLLGVVGFCRAWRDGLIVLGLMRLALALFAASGPPSARSSTWSGEWPGHLTPECSTSAAEEQTGR